MLMPNFEMILNEKFNGNEYDFGCHLKKLFNTNDSYFDWDDQKRLFFYDGEFQDYEECLRRVIKSIDKEAI